MMKLESIIYCLVPQIYYKSRVVCLSPVEFLKHNDYGFRFQDSIGVRFRVSGVSKQMTEDRKQPATSYFRPELKSKAVESKSDRVRHLPVCTICLLSSGLFPLKPEHWHLKPFFWCAAAAALRGKDLVWNFMKSNVVFVKFSHEQSTEDRWQRSD